MGAALKKEELIEQMQGSSRELSLFCATLPNEIFFQVPGIKWSIAQNVDHLTRAAASTKLAFTLPKFIIRLYVGKPNRPSRTYDELLSKYNQKLANGGKASRKFIPPDLHGRKLKEKIMADYSDIMEKLCSRVNNNWEDQQLDRYIAPHPLLGKITLRELCYFTILHTRHHFQTIRERAEGR